jgi:NADH-quinone oxidoreductase subunit D
MDYLAPLIYNCAYAMAVEKLMDIEVTERCKVVRVICMELDRIFSHLLWLGTTAIDIGAFTVFLYTFQERERIYICTRRSRARGSRRHRRASAA